MTPTSTSNQDAPLTLRYEHPEWFNPPVAVSHRTGMPYTRLLVHEHRFDPNPRVVNFLIERVRAGQPALGRV